MIGSSPGLPRMLTFLFDLAWASRVRLPLLIAVAFMITNVHMRLEININFEMVEHIVAQDEDGEENENNEDEDEQDDENNHLLIEAELELEESNDDENDEITEENASSESASNCVSSSKSNLNASLIDEYRSGDIPESCVASGVSSSAEIPQLQSSSHLEHSQR